MNDNYIKIPGRLSNASTDGVVSGANEIYDDDLLMWQSDINQVAISGGGGSVVLPISASDVLDSNLNKRQDVINSQFNEDIEELKQSQGGDSNAGTVILHLEQDGSFWFSNTKGFFKDDDYAYDEDELRDSLDFKRMISSVIQKPILVPNDISGDTILYSGPVLSFQQSSDNGATAIMKDHEIVLEILIDQETGDSYLQYTIHQLLPEYYTKNEVYNKTEIDAMLPQLSLYKCTQAEYDAIVSKNPDTLYIITT